MKRTTISYPQVSRSSSEESHALCLIVSRDPTKRPVDKFRQVDCSQLDESKDIEKRPELADRKGDMFHRYSLYPGACTVPYLRHIHARRCTFTFSLFRVFVIKFSWRGKNSSTLWPT